MSGPVKFACACCGYPTLDQRGAFDTCILCNWEDDGQDNPAKFKTGGPNGDYTLVEARINWEARATAFRPADPRFAKQRPGRKSRLELAERLIAFRWAPKVVLSSGLLGEIEVARRRILWSCESGEET